MKAFKAVYLLLSLCQVLMTKTLVGARVIVNVDLYRYILIMNRILLMVGNTLSVKLTLKIRGFYILFKLYGSLYSYHCTT